MTLATEVKKLTESKPFYAVAGAGDYAVEKLRELPEQLHKLQARRQELTKDLPEKARTLTGKAEGFAKDFPGKARAYADEIGHKATEVYEEFASRGRKVVTKGDHQAAPELEESAPAKKPTRTTKAKS
ncbi:hypothetical protein [Nonomuraea longicatena]|uniref:Uncharacterized protein n=1 Tax=Nonomuraea longicatena TaxID=83682 RepID=A0ABN1QTX5_9ACTN